MGEEAKHEQAQAEAKPEEKPVEEKREEAPPAEEKKEEAPPPPPPAEEEKKEEQPPQPPQPFILYVDLHCTGCAKKIERSIMKIRGVEGVAIDMAQNQVTIKGVVEPQAICNIITKKTKRVAKVLSPLPANEGEPIPEVVTSQVSGLAAVELNVNMHCEACAEQLKKKILKMRGVQTAETEFSTGKVKVTGTMDANKLVDYLYRRTKKQARIVPQPEPETPPEEPKPEPEPEKPAEEPKPEEGSNNNPAEAPMEGPPAGDNNEQNPPQEPPKEGEGGGENTEKPPETPAEGGGGGDGGGIQINNNNVEEESMNKRMMYNNYYPPHQYYQQPLYYIERIPPPQLFSDENPNACCIS